MMKALILKDFYMLQKQFRVVLAVMVLYALFFVPQGMVDMMAFMMVMFGVMYVMTSMSFDETLKWDRYALCAPMRRRDMVRAKYVTAILLLAAGFSLSFLIYALTPLFFAPPRPLAESLLGLASACMTGLLMISAIMPMMYKFGVEKSRLLLIGVIMLPIVLVVLYAKYAPPGLTLLLNRYALYIPVGLALLAAVAFFVSYKISLRIYNNKDF